MENILLGIKYFVVGISAFLVASPTPTPTPQPTAIPLSENIVTRSGEYSYQGYTLKYTINVPKEGGTITGAFSDVCVGPINGTYYASSGKIEGEAKATCKIAFISYDLAAKYNGNLNLREGKIDLNWEGEIPATSHKGSFTVNFEPLK